MRHGRFFFSDQPLGILEKGWKFNFVLEDVIKIPTKIDDIDLENIIQGKVNKKWQFHWISRF